MSIVEKALHKLQSKRSESGLRTPPRPTLPVPISRPRGSSVADAADGLPSTAPGPRNRPEPARRVHVDLDALRAQGMLASPEVARQVTDQYRRIKWPLLDVAFGRGVPRLERGNLIMIASSLPNEGKTFTALNLALNIALERDSTVVLIDADVAKAHTTRLLGLREERGLTDVLNEPHGELADVVLATDIDGLEILPAGHSNAHAPELFASRRMEELLAEAAEHMPGRILLFDSSPVLATNEAQVLARLVGQVLLVVRAEETSQAAVLEALSLLEGSRSISCVLNDARSGPGRDYYVAYDYHHEQQRDR